MINHFQCVIWRRFIRRQFHFLWNFSLTLMWQQKSFLGLRRYALSLLPHFRVVWQIGVNKSRFRTPWSMAQAVRAMWCVYEEIFEYFTHKLTRKRKIYWSHEQRRKYLNFHRLHAGSLNWKKLWEMSLLYSNNSRSLSCCCCCFWAELPSSADDLVAAFHQKKDERRLSSADDEPNLATNSFIHSTLHCIVINYHADATLSLVQIVVVYILFLVACAVCSIENSVAHGELFKSTENPQVLAFVCSIRHNEPPLLYRAVLLEFQQHHRHRRRRWWRSETHLKFKT